MSRSVLGVEHSPIDAPLPAGTTDCHVHVFGPPGKYTLSEKRTFMPAPVTMENLVQFHKAIGVQRAVIIQASPQGTDNTCLVDTLAALPGMGLKARGVAVIDESFEERDLKALHAAGVRGVRMNLQSFGIASPAVATEQLRMNARAAALMGWHVQIYASLDVTQALADVISTLGVPVVIDHFGLAHSSKGTGQPGFSTLLDLVKHRPVYVKLSAPYRIADPAKGEDGHDIIRALIDTNIDHMLWGTDWPHTHPKPGAPRPRDTPEALEPIDDGFQVNRFIAWTSADERRKVMVANPAHLYDFEAADTRVGDAAAD